ncbi:MAG TPA: PASTA domain-containing protein [Acidimicrobiales bacterium]|jgi:serine/threonine-protein kinase|nr:PASTA domain-containing protein [Acidimicrobiales bacterium]
MAVFGKEQAGRVLADRYRLVAAVGTGASATVFQADDVQLRRRVAVKVLHPSLADDEQFVKGFHAEAQAASSLTHSNVLTVFDWGIDDGIPFLVTEYLGGGSLRAMLDRGRRLSPSQALLIGLDACKGLDYAHKRGIVHRDIKPGNLLFGEDRRLRIADFGVARAIAQASWTEPPGVLIGSARYASPEQAKGERVDGKSDVYSLTLTLIESVTGQVPFAGETTVATLMNRVDKLMPVSAELGPLASVLEKAGRPAPAERSDAAELGRGLIQAAERLPRPAPLPLVMTSSTLFDAGRGNGALPDDTTAPAGLLREGDAGAEAAAAPPAPGPPPPPVLPPSTTEDDEAEIGPSVGLRRVVLFLGALLIAAAIVIGVLVWRGSSPPVYAVPDLVGLEEGDARNQIATNDWEVSVVRERNDDQPLGYVFRTDPASGELEEGEPFALYVSDGPTPVAVPDIVGMPRADAEAALTEIQLGLRVSGTEFSEDVPVDDVLRYTIGGLEVEPDTEVERGTVVDAVVSGGPAPRTVPDLIGQPQDAVVAALEKLGLVPVQAGSDWSDTVPEGLVRRVQPEAGAEVPKGSEVLYSLSLGRQLATVPNVVGLTSEQANALLQSAGLTIGRHAGNPQRTVFAQDPPAGTQIPVGSGISILFAA